LRVLPSFVEKVRCLSTVSSLILQVPSEALAPILGSLEESSVSVFREKVEIALSDALRNRDSRIASIERNCWLLLLCVALCSCGGGGGDGSVALTSGGPPAPQIVTISGTATDDPLEGATVELHDLGGLLVGSTTTDSSGHFSIEVNDNAVQQGYQLAVKGGQSSGEDFTAELHAVYSPSDDRSDANLRFPEIIRVWFRSAQER